jgi:glycosyltransferase involved in cell wall biosynthesis
LKICYLSDGVSIHDLRFLLSLTKRNYEVHLVSFFPGNLPCVLEKNGIFIHQVKLPNTKPGLFASFVISLFLFRRIVIKIEPDIVHSGYLQGYGFYSAFADYHPILSMPWGSDILIDPRRSRILKEIARFALSRADMITCDCELVKKKILELVDFPRERIIVFPWGVDLSVFNPHGGDGGMRRKLGWEGKFVVIHTRMFSKVYGVRHLIEAIPRVIEEVPYARFLFCGGGPLENEIKEKVRNCNLSSYVYFAGNIANEELPKYLNSADVYVSCSLSDGTSVSLLEAMACGLPVVVTDLPAMLEWVCDGKNGFTVPKMDSKTLSARIIALSKDKILRREFSRKNLIIARNKADWEKNLDILESIYKKLSKQDGCECADEPKA